MHPNISIQIETPSLSLVETGRLDRIETQLKRINSKLDMLLNATISPEQLVKLTQEVDAAKATSGVLAQAIEQNK